MSAGAVTNCSRAQRKCQETCMLRNKNVLNVNVTKRNALLNLYQVKRLEVQRMTGLRTVNLCLVTIKYKNPSWTSITVPLKYVFDFKMIPKGISHAPRFKIPHMNFKKEILVPFRKY
jgi:hypothetical protein